MAQQLNLNIKCRKPKQRVTNVKSIIADGEANYFYLHLLFFIFLICEIFGASIEHLFISGTEIINNKGMTTRLPSKPLMYDQ